MAMNHPRPRLYHPKSPSSPPRHRSIASRRPVLIQHRRISQDGFRPSQSRLIRRRIISPIARSNIVVMLTMCMERVIV
jgi:hypothetical protein